MSQITNQTVSDIISQIGPKNSLSTHLNYNSILQCVSQEISNFPNLVSLKIGGNIELELVKLVCSIVENLVDKGNPLNIDKSQLVCDIFKNIFNLNPQEYDIVKKQIEYIYNNNQIIKIPFLRKLTRMVFNFITKKT